MMYLEHIYQAFPQLKVFWINHSSGRYNLKTFENNNPTIVFNVLYEKEMKICPAYNSKHNSNHEKQTAFIKILNGEAWTFLAVRKLSALLSGY